MKKCGYLKTLLRTKADDTWDNGSPAAFAQISNGTAVAFISRGDNRGSGPLELVLAVIRIDINGTNKPNTKGIDQFDFYLTDSGIIPLGTKDERNWTFNDCQTKGMACTAWILKQKNLNYLHSDKCSWQNTSCK